MPEIAAEYGQLATMNKRWPSSDVQKWNAGKRPPASVPSARPGQIETLRQRKSPDSEQESGLSVA